MYVRQSAAHHNYLALRLVQIADLLCNALKHLVLAEGLDAKAVHDCYRMFGWFHHSKLSHSVLLATFGSIMLRAAPHNLFAQITVVNLACPAEHVIVIANLFCRRKVQKPMLG